MKKIEKAINSQKTDTTRVAAVKEAPKTTKTKRKTVKTSAAMLESAETDSSDGLSNRTSERRLRYIRARRARRAVVLKRHHTVDTQPNAAEEERHLIEPPAKVSNVCRAGRLPKARVRKTNEYIQKWLSGIPSDLEDIRINLDGDSSDDMWGDGFARTKSQAAVDAKKDYPKVITGREPVLRNPIHRKDIIKELKTATTAKLSAQAIGFTPKPRPMINSTSATEAKASKAKIPNGKIKVAATKSMGKDIEQKKTQVTAHSQSTVDKATTSQRKDEKSIVVATVSSIGLEASTSRTKRQKTQAIKSRSMSLSKKKLKKPIKTDDKKGPST